ncbi:MAG: type II toxin-antitoxin system Phd/YefM family antitoxin [Candidatus Gracilibacteria bacterium]
MLNLMPKTASPRDIQRNYRTLFDEVRTSEEPLLILNNNQPDVVVISYAEYSALTSSREEYEQTMARAAIENYESEKKTGKLKALSSLADLA